MNDEIYKANAKLSRVKIRCKGEKLYLRATLPARDGKGVSRCELRTGLTANTEGIKLALAKAQKMESDLSFERFSWEDWLALPGGGTMTVAEAVSQFEANYWERNAKTKSRAANFKTDYLNIFQYLPPDEGLTGEVLRRSLVRFSSDSRDRVRAFMAFGSLAKFSKVELPEDWKTLRGQYKPKCDRVIPNDLEIEELRDQIKDPYWRWVFGMLAAYGLRPHEVYHLDLAEMPVLVVGSETKTGWRKVYPVPARWVEAWRLADAPLLRHDPANHSNRDLGNKISQRFGDLQLGITPYSLRDAYAVRAVKNNISESIAAKWMGNSLDVYHKHYLKYIDEQTHQEIWERLGKRENPTP